MRFDDASCYHFFCLVNKYRGSIIFPIRISECSICLLIWWVHVEQDSAQKLGIVHKKQLKLKGFVLSMLALHKGYNSIDVWLYYDQDLTKDSFCPHVHTQTHFKFHTGHHHSLLIANIRHSNWILGLLANILFLCIGSHKEKDVDKTMFFCAIGFTDCLPTIIQACRFCSQSVTKR